VKALSNVYTMDANVIVRFLTRDDEALWKKASAIIKAMHDGAIELLCDPVTLAEIVFVLGSIYRIPRKQIHQLMNPVVKARGFIIPNKDVYVRAMELYGDCVPHFGDACACAVALKSTGGRLLSLDKKLSAVAGVQRTEEVAQADD